MILFRVIPETKLSEDGNRPLHKCHEKSPKYLSEN